MSEFELDGSRPMMASISLKSMKNIISLLDYELTNGEFEFDAEYSMVKELLDECRQAFADAQESANRHLEEQQAHQMETVKGIVWHTIRPFLNRHTNRGLPTKSGTFLVTTWDGVVTISSLFIAEDGSYFWDLTNNIRAWAEIPEPCKIIPIVKLKWD